MPAPRASYQPASGGTLIVTPDQLAEALRSGNLSTSGQAVNATSAMGVAAVYASVRILSGLVATLPLQIKRRSGDRREDASDTSIWRVLNRRPNGWQKPAQFKRMMQAHVLLRGNAYALKTRNVRGDVVALLPLHPDRVETKQLDDLSIIHIYTRKGGGRVAFGQDEILHLYGLTLDGVRGVTPITYARESIGSAMAMERHGGHVFANGANVSGVLKHAGKLTGAAHSRLEDSMEEFRSGGAREGKTLILEEGMDWQQIALTAEDAQWIEARKFTRGEIFMFFGVFPHTVGDNEGNTQLGSSLEQQTQGMVTFTMEDHLTMWEEGVTTDCIAERDWAELYARFNRNALVRGDIKTRWETYGKAAQFGLMSPNEIRALEDMNPRDGGDIYYDPPNMAGGQSQSEPVQ